MREIFKLGMTLMLYSLTVGAALAFVNQKTAPVIEENRARAEAEARAEVLPDMRGGYELRTASDGFEYWVGYTDAEQTGIGGYIVIAHGKGYSSTIQTMVGIDPSFAITGMTVLFQQETPGLGARVEEIARNDTEPWFPAQFRGLTIDELALTQKGGAIDSITGATISTEAITSSVKEQIEHLHTIVEGQV